MLCDNKSLSLLKEGREQLFVNPNVCQPSAALSEIDFTVSDIDEAEARLSRFAPVIQALFPETEAAGGIIESPLTEITNMRDALCALENGGAKEIRGRLLLKRDSDLPIAGSVKARGGIYEVLKHTEDISRAVGVPVDPLHIEKLRTVLSNYTVQVGSTGNLGLSIGIMSAALGYHAVVHMSCDAKEWKKTLLRQKGVEVIEYDGDYSLAVERGRKLSDADPKSYFVDDENSRELFLGYAVAARRLKAQLDELGIAVDDAHPLNVYLPCGVGGAPGGVCFGLKTVFGSAVRCWFAEPVLAPCMLAALILGKPVSISELGLSGRTIADGLAVGRASALVSSAMSRLLDGEYTVDDSRLLPWLRLLYSTEGLFIEPSACAAFGGLMHLDTIADGETVTHIAWATGGRLVPADERAHLLEC